jgi:hypothetical protein
MKIIGKPKKLAAEGVMAFQTEITAESRIGDIFIHDGKTYKVTQWRPRVIDYDTNGKPTGRYFLAKEVKPKTSPKR